MDLIYFFCHKKWKESGLTAFLREEQLKRKKNTDRINNLRLGSPLYIRILDGCTGRLTTEFDTGKDVIGCVTYVDASLNGH